MKVTVVIPNYNGIKYLSDCLLSLREQSCRDFDTIVVDNGSTDGSYELLEEFPEVQKIRFDTNTGFCTAVNAGIKASKSDYIILLNNDTKAYPDYIANLVQAIEADGRIFSVNPQMLLMAQPDLLDDAGDLYCALGWAFARGKGKEAKEYDFSYPIFAACGGASIYRRSVFEEIGYFDEAHFAYLEDLDIGYRARIFGYRNVYEPSAKVLHAGSGSSGSRYNEFKVALSSANSVYVIGKNMPFLQWVLNLPFLIIGFSVKTFFFLLKGLGGTYLKGLFRGICRCLSKEGRKQHIKFRFNHMKHYVSIQLELWWNIIRRLAG